MKPKRSVLSFGQLAQVAMRSFFIQASWNFHKMQNLGFCFALYPILRKLFPNPKQRCQAVKRHLEFFNTHPYCASLILGVVARLEQKLKEQTATHASEVNRIKQGMMGPLAALGDTVYWARLKPALSLLGVSLVLLAPVGKPWLALTGGIIFLALYSLFHCSLRWGGIWVGYHRGIEVVKDLRRFNPQFIAERIGIFMAVILGTILVAYPMFSPLAGVSSRWVSLVMMAGLITALYGGLRYSFSATHLFYALVIFSVLAASIGWVP